MNDTEQEPQRLREEYSRMTDGELENIALDIADLTAAAKGAIRQELARRGIPIQSVAETNSIMQSTHSSNAADGQSQRVVRRFFSLSEAILAQSKLGAAGVDSLIAEQHTLTTSPYLPDVLGGARLMVDAADAEIANEILNEPIAAEFDVDGIGRYVQPRCPQCFSLNVSFGDLDRTAIALGLPPPISKENWCCQACGCRWEDS